MRTIYKSAAVMTCVGFWRYRPALKNGRPVDVPWKADIKWELHKAPVPEERARLKIFAVLM